MTDSTHTGGDEPVTDFELGQDNIRPFGLDIHNPVFLISSLSSEGVRISIESSDTVDRLSL